MIRPVICSEEERRERVRRGDEAKQRAEGTEGDEWVDSAIEQMRCFSNIQRD